MVSGSQAGPSMGKGVYIRRVPDGAAPGPMCKESRRLKRVYVRFVSTLRIKCQRRASPGVGAYGQTSSRCASKSVTPNKETRFSVPPFLFYINPPSFPF